MRYPDLVHKLVVIGTTYNNDGLVSGLLENFKTIKPKTSAEFRAHQVAPCCWTRDVSGFEKYWLAAPTNTSSTKNEIEYARLADKMQRSFSTTLERSNGRP
jgi:hypothetical protein